MPARPFAVHGFLTCVLLELLDELPDEPEPLLPLLDELEELLDDWLKPGGQVIISE